ncbi:MAG: ABC transporter ATP-binding protein [Deltaproteobacteria bacterium]|nr:ABC transporter ATP-binding protein [Deltaproteobacteria bacterium]MCX7953316.1 ABC transporter ATP-binding protein [Deltaproteobacteria bacterium]
MDDILLRIKGLTKRFGGVVALNNFSIEIKKGLIYGLIGPNGAGKTTLFNVLSGFLDPDEGQIRFLNTDILKLKPFERANIFSRSFQLTRNFLNLTVQDNLLLSFRSNYESILSFIFFKYEEEKELLKQSSSFLRELDVSLDFRALARDLSYGQSKLLEMVRCVLRPHQILLLDEPVAGVNPETRKKINHMLKLQKEKGDTIILIEHDINFVMTCSDYVFALAEGKLIAQGSPLEVRNNPQVLKSYLGETESV